MTVVVDALSQAITLSGSNFAANSPRVGEVWLTAWDDEDLALVVLAAVRRGYVLAWPVTAVTDHDTFPCLPITVETASSPLTVWPDAEFGLSEAVLSECVGVAFDDKTVRLIVGGLSGDCDMPVATFPDVPTANAESDLELVCAQAWDLADIEWPLAAPGHGVLNSEALKASGVNARELASVLGATPGRAAGLASARAIPSNEELVLLSGAIADLRDLLTTPSGSEVGAILHPRFKRNIREAARRSSLSEVEVRTQLYVVAEQMAARASMVDAGEAEVFERVEAALHSLLEEA